MITITIHDDNTTVRIRRLKDEISGLEDTRIIALQTRQRTSDKVVEARRSGHHAEAEILLGMLEYYAAKEEEFNKELSKKVRQLRELLR